MESLVAFIFVAALTLICLDASTRDINSRNEYYSYNRLYKNHTILAPRRARIVCPTCKDTVYIEEGREAYCVFDGTLLKEKENAL